MMQLCRAPSRTKVTLIIKIPAIGNVFEVKNKALPLHYGEQLVFAVKAAGLIVSRVLWP